MKYIFDIPDNVDYGVLTCRTSNGYYEYNFDGADLEKLPPVQPEQTEMIKEIRKWINSSNRGNADYFIVDKIEEIINKYE